MDCVCLCVCVFYTCICEHTGSNSAVSDAIQNTPSYFPRSALCTALSLALVCGINSGVAIV